MTFLEYQLSKKQKQLTSQQKALKASFYTGICVCNMTGFKGNNIHFWGQNLFLRLDYVNIRGHSGHQQLKKGSACFLRH